MFENPGGARPPCLPLPTLMPVVSLYRDQLFICSIYGYKQPGINYGYTMGINVYYGYKQPVIIW